MKKKNNNLGFFMNQFPACNIEVCHVVNRERVMYGFGKNTRISNYSQSNNTSKISFDMVNHDYAYDFVNGISSGNMSVFALGSGFLCEYCGNYCPKGNVVCYRCGALQNEQENIKPENIDIINMYHTEEGHTSLSGITISYSSLEITIPSSQVSLMLHNSYPGYNIVLDSYYLCDWCGMAVPDGDVCFGCAGIRKPLQEIVKIEKNCLYCGEKVLGNYQCPSCSARVSGQTLEEYIMSLSGKIDI